MAPLDAINRTTSVPLLLRSPLSWSTPRSNGRKRPRQSLVDISHLPTPVETHNRFLLSTVFLLLGIGVLLPWNAYISAKPYFQARLFDCSSPNQDGSGNSGGDTMEAWFSLLFNGGSVISLAIMIVLQYCWYNQVSSSTTTVTKSSSNNNWYLVMVPLGIYLLVFIGTALLVLLPFVPPTIFWAWTFLGFTICGVCTSIASAGIVATAGSLDEHLGIHPYFNGQAIGGLIVAMGNLIADYWNQQPNNQRTSACQDYTEISWPTFGYFAASCLVLALCMIGYSVILRVLSLADMVDDDNDESPFDDDDDDDQDFKHVPSYPTESSPLLRNLPEADEESNGFYYYKKPSGCEDTDSTCSNTTKSSISVDNVSNGSLDNGDKDLPIASLNLTVRVLYSVWGPALCLFTTYFVTLAIFPVWTSELASTHATKIQDTINNDSTATLLDRIQTDLYTPMTFCVFNAGDLMGRLLSSWRSPSSGLVTASLMRVAFFLLFVTCPSTFSSTGLISSDGYSWLIQWAFAISNGYLTNVAFSLAPNLVESRAVQPQQVASSILNWSLSLGLLCGSWASFYYLEWARQVNTSY